jgi:hypothetical protein
MPRFQQAVTVSMVGKKKPEYITLKEPSDVMRYVQRLVNRVRREGLELDPEYFGKLTNLLQLWLSAYKTNLESIEAAQLREEIAEIRRTVEAMNRDVIFEKR